MKIHEYIRLGFVPKEGVVEYTKREEYHQCGHDGRVEDTAIHILCLREFQISVIEMAPFQQMCEFSILTNLLWQVLEDSNDFGVGGKGKKRQTEEREYSIPPNLLEVIKVKPAFSRCLNFGS